MMTAAVTGLIAGQVDLFGVSFHPGAARQVVALDLHEITDGQCDLAGQAVLRLPSPEALAERKSFVARRKCIEKHLIDRIAYSRKPDARILQAVQLLEASRGRVAVADLCAASGLGERRLERMFALNVGVSPQMLDGIFRFRTATELMRSQPTQSLAEIALTAGYYDQAHFSREFHRFAGLPPATWRKDDLRVGIVQEAELPSA
jgi:transcriptional regulator GlxA family with amidase domain